MNEICRIVKEAQEQSVYWQELSRLEFAVLLNEEMERRGVTREQLSKRTGVSKRYISEVLGGNAEGLKLSTMSKLMYELGSKLELNCVVVPELVANGKVSECVSKENCLAKI